PRPTMSRSGCLIPPAPFSLLGEGGAKDPSPSRERGLGGEATPSPVSLQGEGEANSPPLPAGRGGVGGEATPSRLNSCIARAISNSAPTPCTAHGRNSTRATG